jgi:hypothetical protein
MAGVPFGLRPMPFLASCVTHAEGGVGRGPHLSGAAVLCCSVVCWAGVCLFSCSALLAFRCVCPSVGPVCLVLSRSASVAALPVPCRCCLRLCRRCCCRLLLLLCLFRCPGPLCVVVVRGCGSIEGNCLRAGPGIDLPLRPLFVSCLTAVSPPVARRDLAQDANADRRACGKAAE